MKKMKTALSAIAIFAVVGGALAFTPTVNQRVCRTAPDVSTGSPICNPGGTDLLCDAGAPQTSRKINTGTTDCYRIVSASVTNCNTVSCPNLGGVAAQP
jgi:hypothetical protein